MAMSAVAEPPVKLPTPVAKTPLPRYHNTYQWRGHKINYLVEGPADGIPMLLIHGFGASVGHWRNNIPAFVEKGYKCYAIDLLGFGGSDKPKEVEYSLELWQEMLLDFIRDKSTSESEKWIVMGNSIGGLLTVMVTAALQESNKIKGSVLFNCAGGLVSFRKEEVPWYYLPLWWFVNEIVFGDVIGPMFFKNFKTRENVAQTLQQVYIKKDAVDDQLIDMLLAPSDDEGATEVFLKVFRGPAGPAPEDLLPLIKTKVLCLWGEQDNWTTLRAGLHPGIRFPEYCDSLELVPLPNTGHCPHDENPELCHSKIFPWLETLP